MTIHPDAIAVYEQLRAELLTGHGRPDGLSAIIHHGMLRGLAVMLTQTPAMPSDLEPRAQAPPSEALPLDKGFLRLVANMLLQCQEEESHVY